MSFPIIYCKKIDHNALLPVKTNQSDAGYDIFAHSGPRVVGRMADDHGHFWHSIDYIEMGTGLIFEPLGSVYDDPNPDQYLQIFPRSSISNYNLIFANSIAVIDPLYRKEVLIRFKYLPQPEDYSFDKDRVFITINTSKIYQVGNKIAQIIPSKVSNINFIEVDKINESQRAGFGSTGI